MLKTFLKVAATCLAMGLFLYLYKTALGSWIEGTGMIESLLKFSGGVAGSAVIVLGLYRLLKIEMLEHLFRRKR